MKIKFKKFAATSTFIKLFGADKNKPDANQTKSEEEGDAYEYYYKRGNTYYFRNKEGNKISIDYKEPQKELIKGQAYKLDSLNNQNS